MSVLSDIENDIRTWAADLTDRADKLVTQAAPVVHDASETLESLTKSKIVTELQQYGEDLLPPETVDAIVSLIKGAGEAATKIAQLTAPPAGPAADSAEAQPG